MYSRIDVLKALPDNFIPIWYEFMFRGNAVQRILSAHSECAWEKQWCSSPDPSNTLPLDFPETHSAYLGSDENIKRLGESESHAWAHTGFRSSSFRLKTLLRSSGKLLKHIKINLFSFHNIQTKTLLSV